MNPTKKSSPLSDFKSKLKASDPEIQRYIVALEKENSKLHEKIAKQQVENVSSNNRIKALEKEFAKLEHNYSSQELIEALTKSIEKFKKADN